MMESQQVIAYGVEEVKHHNVAVCRGWHHFESLCCMYIAEQGHGGDWAGEEVG